MIALRRATIATTMMKIVATLRILVPPGGAVDGIEDTAISTSFPVHVILQTGAIRCCLRHLRLTATEIAVALRAGPEVVEEVLMSKPSISQPPKHASRPVEACMFDGSDTKGTLTAVRVR